MYRNAGLGLKFVSLVVVLFLLHPSVLDGGCRCGDGALDLVLLIDATGSMHIAIGTVKAQMAKIIDILSGRFESLRVGVVAYRTASGPDFVVKTLQLTADTDKVKEFLADLRASGGGGEAVCEGLDEAVNRMVFAPDARKIIVLVGDEPAAEGTRDQALLVAAEAKTRGIIVHSITMSETAWRYFEFNNPKEFAELKAKGLSDAELSSSFVLPSFRRISEAASGSAVPGVKARDIVKWLLALSTGDSGLGDVADEVMRMEQSRSQAVLSRGPVLMGRLTYAGGDCHTPRDNTRLLAHMKELLPVRDGRILDSVSLQDERLASLPLLYLSGHGPINLTDAEEKALKRYLESGGRLWADACCGNAEFEKSFMDIMNRLFPAHPLVEIPASHQVFRAAVRMDKVRYTTKHRVASYREGSPVAFALDFNDRTAVVYTPHSWGAGWGSYPFGVPCLMHDDDALALSLNLLVYWMEGH